MNSTCATSRYAAAPVNKFVVLCSHTRGLRKPIEGIDDVVVWGETNFLTGQVVYAKVKTGLSETEARQTVGKHCGEKLERHKRPVRIIVTADNLYGERYKKGRVQHD